MVVVDLFYSEQPYMKMRVASCVPELALTEMDLQLIPVGRSTIGKYLDILLNYFCNSFVPADWLKKNNHHSLGQDRDLLSCFPYGKLYSMWKKREDTCFYTSCVLLGLCEKQNVHYFIQDQLRGFGFVSYCTVGMIIQAHNFLIAVASFSTCLESALLHTSVSANVNSLELYLPVSCRNHQTKHERFLPVCGEFTWPWTCSPVARAYHQTKSLKSLRFKEKFVMKKSIRCPSA